jgi:DNA-directed RNA polymerase subunit M/transcription elongation factor TFIIS
MAEIRASAVASITRVLNDALKAEPKSSHNIEIGIYNWTVAFAEEKKFAICWNSRRFTNVYEDKLYTVLTNLVTNSSLQRRMVEKEFDSFQLPTMSPQHVHPVVWKDAMDKKITRDEYVMNDKPEAMTEDFKCRKCKNNKCVFKELQLRSADEPMTLFITCLNCGNRWRH